MILIIYAFAILFLVIFLIILAYIKEERQLEQPEPLFDYREGKKPEDWYNYEHICGSCGNYLFECKESCPVFQELMKQLRNDTIKEMYDNPVSK